jgi:hypothetical protein
LRSDGRQRGRRPTRPLPRSCASTDANAIDPGLLKHALGWTFAGLARPERGLKIPVSAVRFRPCARSLGNFEGARVSAAPGTDTESTGDGTDSAQRSGPRSDRDLGSPGAERSPLRVMCAEAAFNPRAQDHRRWPRQPPRATRVAARLSTLGSRCSNRPRSHGNVRANGGEPRDLRARVCGHVWMQTGDRR